jgi:release factor glutamine methyltransferase
MWVPVQDASLWRSRTSCRMPKFLRQIFLAKRWALRNASRHSLGDRVLFLQTDLLESVNEANSFDLIASNPPYVACNESHQLPREVREHEPASALFGGLTGAEIYPRLIEQAATLLRHKGILVLELGHNSLDHVRPLLYGQPAWVNVSVTNDLAGIPRVIAAERS